MIKFNIPPFTGKETDYMKEAILQEKICGDGSFTRKCSALMEEQFHAEKVLLTTSCTSALEMSALLCDIHPGDEVIMPSFTFVSTADAFVLRGGIPVFVDIRPDTMNIDESLIEAAITPNTKAICVVHYAGVACEMDTIRAICEKYHLLLVEDAAQGVNAYYKGKTLGTLSDFGCFSFHETKNYSMGEGGAIIVNNKQYIEAAEIIREKGTDRSRFLRGQVDKYTWVEKGASYLPSDILAAYLYAQLEKMDEINETRLKSWNIYFKLLKPLAEQGKIDLPTIPEYCTHNAHMFYIKAKDIQERTELIHYLKEQDITAVFHYIPLHSAPAGLKYGRFHGKDIYTTKESERLIRLPLYYNLKEEDLTAVTDAVKDFYR